MPGWYDDGSEEEHQMRQAARKAEKALERELASREGENIEDNADVRMVRPLDRDVLGSEEADALSVSTANAGTTNNLLEPAERPEQTHTPLPWAVHESFKTCVIPIYDARKRLGGAADPDVEATSHAKIITWQEGSEYTKFYRSRVMKDEAIANAQFIVTACNNYEALKQSHAGLMEALTRAERKLMAYVGVCTGDKELTGTILPMAHAALANAKALEGL